MQNFRCDHTNFWQWYHPLLPHLDRNMQRAATEMLDYRLDDWNRAKVYFCIIKYSLPANFYKRISLNCNS